MMIKLCIIGSLLIIFNGCLPKDRIIKQNTEIVKCPKIELEPFSIEPIVFKVVDNKETNTSTIQTEKINKIKDNYIKLKKENLQLRKVIQKINSF